MVVKEEFDEELIESCIYSSRSRTWSDISEKDESEEELIKPIDDPLINGKLISEELIIGEEIKMSENETKKEEVRKLSQKLIQSIVVANYGVNCGSQLRVKKQGRKVSREEALVLLLQMNESYAKVPSCFSNLMEDRIEAHKLLGIKSTQDLATLSLKLSQISSSGLTGVKRRFIDVSKPSNCSKTINSIIINPHSNCSKTITNCSKNKGNHVTIMSWNVLSQAIGYHMDKFDTCSESDLLWSSRKWKIIHELAQYSPGILCLQEVDKFYFIHKLLQKVGYDGKFVPKPDSPCNYLPSNTGPDGCAIFYDTNQFTLINSVSHVMHVCNVPSNQVALICTFKIKKLNKLFIIATTHLKARKSELLAKLRTEQAHDLLSFIHEYMSINGYSKSETPIIITGDFNGEKNEPFYDVMTEKLASAYDSLASTYTSYDSLASDQDSEKVTLPPSDENDKNATNLNTITPTNYHSNWTRRVNEEEIKQTIDYIFYNANLMKVETLLELSSTQLLAPIPNAKYPSDHLSLVASFSFL